MGLTEEQWKLILESTEIAIKVERMATDTRAKKIQHLVEVNTILKHNQLYRESGKVS